MAGHRGRLAGVRDFQRRNSRLRQASADHRQVMGYFGFAMMVILCGLGVLVGWALRSFADQSEPEPYDYSDEAGA